MPSWSEAPQQPTMRVTACHSTTTTWWPTCADVSTRCCKRSRRPTAGGTSRVQRPVLILGRLDGVETGVRNLIRRRALEVAEVKVGRRKLRVPTLEEILRIKAWLCLIRNATRDYLDVVALAERLGEDAAATVLRALDDYYEDQQGQGGHRIATQVAKQLAEPRPFDLAEVDLRFYRRLEPRYQDWSAVADAARRLAVRVLEQAAVEGPSR